ncbi:fasciclin domain-containing protein [Methanosarcina hadiensis]|uniref:fasciclin domain-containing protein n=1 Tax=Methanosarcina hadiensis TaxID=3078083 RepID=UPI0039778F09
MLLIAGMLFVSGCAEDTQEETGTEEGVTPVEEAAVTEVEEEPSGEDAGEGAIPGQEEESPVGGEEGIIPGEEEPGLGENETAEGGNQTIVGAAESAGYTTFASVVRDAGLEDTLNQGTYTVFAPTNEAFDALPEGTLEDLSEEELTEVLTYHVVEGEYMASDLESGQTLTTVQTGTLPVSITDNEVTIGTANVVEPDIIANNGIIHGIDEVLLPPAL